MGQAAQSQDFHPDGCNASGIGGRQKFLGKAENEVI
jgi:hypothetical protein